MVNPDWLRYFQTVAELGSFKAAADQLHVTPQTLSSAISGLEEHFQQPLIDRGRRIRGLTRGGEILLEEVSGILASLDRAEGRLEALRLGEPEGEVSLASVSYVNNYLLPERIARLCARYPGVVPRVVAMRTMEAERAVALGEVDLAILLQRPSRPGLAWRKGPDIRYVLVGTPSWRIAPEDLRFLRPVDHEPEEGRTGCSSEESLDRVWGRPRRTVARVDLLETCLCMCAAGLGAAYLPEYACRSQLEAGALVVLDEVPGGHRDELFLTWREGAHLSLAARSLLEAF